MIAVTITSSSAVGTTLNFWNDGYPGGPTPPLTHPIAVTPTIVHRGDPDRTGSDAVANTEIAMQMLLAIPLNRTAMSGIPANQQEKNSASKNRWLGNGLTAC